MNATNPWARFLLIAGYITMLIGAIDPMEGSLLILPGSGLVALGTYFSDEEHSVFIYRLWVFFLIFIGVGALFGFSLLGDTTAYSIWWALLILPYPRVTHTAIHVGNKPCHVVVSRLFNCRRILTTNTKT